MTNITILDDHADSDDVIILGDETASSKISFQLAQEFYHEITGSLETTRENSNSPFILKLSNIEQLHQRIVQATEQYNVCSFKEQYTVSFIDDSSERYSSFARLKLQVAGRGSAVEELIVKYKLLIVLPKTQKPQEYTVNLKFASRVAKIESMRKEISGMPINFPLFHLENAKTAIFSIDYIDISVANAIMSVIKQWFNGVEKNNFNPFFRKVRSKSHAIPIFFKYSFLFLVSFFSYKMSLNLEAFSEKSWYSTEIFILFSILAGFLAYKLGLFLGTKAERNLDDIYEYSYIGFSEADLQLVQNSKAQVMKNRLNVIFYVVITIVLGAAGSLLANWLIS